MIGLWTTAAFLVAFIIGAIIVATIRDRHHESAWRREEGLAPPQRGRHRAPKPLPAVIERKPTGDAPPWDYLPAPVIEPAAVTSGPPEPEPEAYWLAAGTISDGQVLTTHLALLPPVEELLGHPTTEAAVEAMAAEWHSVASIFNGHHVREVRALTDGAS